MRKFLINMKIGKSAPEKRSKESMEVGKMVFKSV